jgi:hypothetical protein
MLLLINKERVAVEVKVNLEHLVQVPQFIPHMVVMDNSVV